MKIHKLNPLVWLVHSKSKWYLCDMVQINAEERKWMKVQVWRSKFNRDLAEQGYRIAFMTPLTPEQEKMYEVSKL